MDEKSRALRRDPCLHKLPLSGNEHHKNAGDVVYSLMYHLLKGLHAHLTRKEEFSVIILGTFFFYLIRGK
jgi:hypothetical protein